MVSPSPFFIFTNQVTYYFSLFSMSLLQKLFCFAVLAFWYLLLPSPALSANPCPSIPQHSLFSCFLIPRQVLPLVLEQTLVMTSLVRGCQLDKERRGS